MRIAHFTTEFGMQTIGGAGTCVNELYKASGEETEIIFLSENGKGASACQERVRRVSYYEMDALNSLEFDVAVFHYYGLSYLVDETFLRGRKLIYVVHSVPTTEPWSLLQPYGDDGSVPYRFERMCDSADLIVCVSEAEREKLLLLYPDLEAKCRAIRNGLAQPSAPAAEWKAAAGSRVYGFLGRCDYRKGLREAIEVLAKIDGKLIIACGDEDPEYQQAAKADIRGYGLGGRVQWIGRVEDDEGKAAFFQSIDALIVPSRWEPFGYVALESLRAGVPPIVSSRGGMMEIVGMDYRYRFDPWDREDFIRCMIMFQNDSAAKLQSELSAAVRLSEQLTGTRMLEQYHQLAIELQNQRLSPNHDDIISLRIRKRRYSAGAAMLSGQKLLSGSRNASATPPLPSKPSVGKFVE